MNKLIENLLRFALSRGMSMDEALLIADFKLCTVVIEDDILSSYVDVMKIISLLHSLVGGVDASSYETFNLDKIEMLRDPKIAKVGLPRFQEKRKADLLRISPNLQSDYDSFVSSLGE